MDLKDAFFLILLIVTAPLWTVVFMVTFAWKAGLNMTNYFMED